MAKQAGVHLGLRGWDDKQEGEREEEEAFHRGADGKGADGKETKTTITTEDPK